MNVNTLFCTKLASCVSAAEATSINARLIKSTRYLVTFVYELALRPYKAVRATTIPCDAFTAIKALNLVHKA